MHINIRGHHQSEYGQVGNEIKQSHLSIFFAGPIAIVDQMSIVASATSPCIPLDGLKPNGVL
jgi:hypothetical protein